MAGISENLIENKLGKSTEMTRNVDRENQMIGVRKHCRIDDIKLLDNCLTINLIINKFDNQ